MAYQTATHHTLQNKRNGIIRQLLTQIKRQVSDGISDSYPPHTTKQEMWHIRPLPKTRDKSVMAYQTATHHTLQNKSNGKSDCTDQKTSPSDGISDSYPPHTTKQESNGKSDSYLTQIKRQISDGIIKQLPTTHYKKQESNGISDSYLTQIKRQVSHSISHSYPHHTLQNKRVMANQTAT
ncbi:unnamed protein product [Mytilus edulis]|uniref:Uncharacterized protein n=1 Tax=Mytilus edulis TaxID=6550 RepID=A0A8S3RY42_MYTED|nr:unnamed protein product [Mytilus edulis]